RLEKCILNFKIKRRQTKQALISMYALIPRLKPWAFTLDSSVSLPTSGLFLLSILTYDNLE
ncbi:MAG: hypothetical protein LRY37_04900, partial [Alkalibacterium thalassium]|nr:hypothetical protein [Alkalibacterium thalassium]